DNTGLPAQSAREFNNSLIALLLHFIRPPFSRYRSMLLRTPAATARQSLRSVRTAFTLLEVLVVVAIIVMLAGVGGYYLLQRYDDAKVSRAKIDCETLSGWVETYKLNNNDYPQSIEALAAGQPNGGGPLAPPDKVR